MRLEVIAAGVVLISACGTPSGTDAGTDAGSDAGTMMTTDAGQVVGTLQILHTVSQFGDSSSFFGKVYDGPTPLTTLFTADLVDGDCRVETPRVPFCATPCGGSAACVEDNVCQAYPTSRNMGTLSASGLLVGGVVTPFEMTPINNGYQAPASVTLSIPPFTDGALLGVTASGSGAVGPFTVVGTGVAPITLSQASDAGTWALAPNTALDLQWTAGSTATAARIEVEIDISHHGGLRGQILCDTADDGSLTIGGTLTTRLINLGVSGFPTMKVRRIKKSSTGRVDFKVVSGTEVGLTIPGLTSCTDDSECPMGQTCQTDLRCQ
ncbi:MAG: hypothetical protein JNM17_31780 [Archangium sp.]|nr:hypothetical protein [Archangium sp.]